MLKQLATWFVVGLPLLIGIAPYAQEGKWAAEDRQQCALCQRFPDEPVPKMLSGANAFEISDIGRMNIGAHQPDV